MVNKNKPLVAPTVCNAYTEIKIALSIYSQIAAFACPLVVLL